MHIYKTKKFQTQHAAHSLKSTVGIGTKIFKVLLKCRGKQCIIKSRWALKLVPPFISSINLDKLFTLSERSSSLKGKYKYLPYIRVVVRTEYIMYIKCPVQCLAYSILSRDRDRYYQRHFQQQDTFSSDSYSLMEKIHCVNSTYNHSEKQSKIISFIKKHVI